MVWDEVLNELQLTMYTTSIWCLRLVTRHHVQTIKQIPSLLTCYISELCVVYTNSYARAIPIISARPEHADVASSYPCNLANSSARGIRMMNSFIIFASCKLAVDKPEARSRSSCWMIRVYYVINILQPAVLQRGKASNPSFASKPTVSTYIT